MVNRIIEDSKPTIMASIGMVSAGGNLAVWMDLIKGWAALATVVLGVPTAILILCYWTIKVRNAWVNRDKGDTD